MVKSAYVLKRVSLSFLLVFILLSFSCEKEKTYPILGIDPIPNVARFEDHSEALIHWAEAGIRDAVIVNIDTHDDIRRISKEKVMELEDIYMRKDWNALEEADSLSDKSLYNVGNFIFAAAKLGIVKEAYWIIPFAHFSYPDTADRLRTFLGAHGFVDEDIKTFKMSDKCFRGSTDGIPLYICGIEALPEINEPIILSFDLDTMPTAAFEYKGDKTFAIQKIFDAFFNKRYRVLDAIVAYSVNGGYMKVIDRWLGDEAAKVIADPTYRGSQLWDALKQADIAYKQKRLGKSMDQLMPKLGMFAQEPSVQMYIAYGSFELGLIEDAFSYAEEACLSDRNYCYGLIEMGNEVHLSGSDKWEKFYRRGHELNQDMNYKLINFALSLRNTDRLDDSLEIFFRHRKMNSRYPVDFMIGQTYLMKGNEKESKKYFDSARIYMRSSLYAKIKHVVEMDAIKSAYDFYMKRGMQDSALELKNNPKLSAAFQ
jgi:hypothetical protein